MSSMELSLTAKLQRFLSFQYAEMILAVNAFGKNCEGKSLNIVIKRGFICSNPYIYTTVVQEVYKRDRSPEIDDVERLAVVATKHLELLKQKF